MNYLAVSIILLYTGIATCYYNEPNYPLLLQPFAYNDILMSQASQSRHKRQTPDMYAILQCAVSISEEQCTSGFNEKVANNFAQCGQNDLARVKANQCARNEMGEFCIIGYVSSFNNIISVFTDCQAEVNGSETCSSKCGNALRTLRNEIGCCINMVFNVSVSGDAGSTLSSAFVTISQYFSYSLWMRCGVETVNQCPNPPMFTPGTRDPPCSDIEALQSAVAFQCTQTNVQAFLDSLNMNSNCSFFSDSLINSCGQRRNGDFCTVYAISNQTIDLFTSVVTNCNSSINIQACSSSCQTSIEHFRDNVGCCLNNIYNQSSVAVPATSYQLWNACGVSSPGFCDSSLTLGPTSTEDLRSGSASISKAFSVVIIALVAISSQLILRW